MEVEMDDELRWYTATWLLGLFGGALFDQVALPAVAAGVESTGRVRYTPWARAARTAASEQVLIWGDASDSRAESERLRELHRDIKGVGYNGVRYSALTPESWNWILISTFLMHRNAYTPLTGKQLSPADDQALWEEFRQNTAGLQFGSQAGLPATYVEVRDYYDKIVREKGTANKTLDGAVDSMQRPPMPPALPMIAKPAWAVLAPPIGHVVTTYSFGIMHPGVRKLTTVRWSRARDAEFALLCLALQSVYRTLPKKLAYTPLAYNRWQYEKLVGDYRSLGLTSFSPDAAVPSGCPLG
jgi:uncharacterized protein (DUF2236 family)